MKRFSTAIITVLTGCLILYGCIGPSRVYNAPQATIVELEKKDHHVQTIAVIMAHTPPTLIGQKTGEHFLGALLESMRHENPELNLVSEGNDQFPDFLEVFKEDDAPLDLFAIADVARRKGYQGFLVAQVLDIHARTEETGLLFWRKPRHFVSIALSLDLYDPFTGAKMVSQVQEETFKVNASDYNRLQTLDKGAVGIEKLDKVIADMAETFAEKAAGHMAELPWKTTVLSVEDQAVILAGGGRSGLQVSEQLDVFANQRTMQGPDNQKYVVPGYKVGRIRVVAIEGRFMRAVAEGKADIAVGDMAVVAQ